MHSLSGPVPNTFLPSSLKRFAFVWLLMFVSSLSLITGCGTLGNGRGWGQDAIYSANSKRISKALYDASMDWETLIPAGGALGGFVDHFDRRGSDWAVRYNPLYGSGDSAGRASNYLLGILQAEVFLTALATPSGDDPKQWVSSKTKGLSVEAGAELATAVATTAIKNMTHRNRPGGEGKSFPAGHSSSAFAGSTLANRNLEWIPMHENLRFALQAGNLLLATAIAWARIEAHAHFPTDVLAGAALGHFLGASIHDAFMGLPEEKPFQINVFPEHGGAVLAVSFPF